MEQNRQQSTVLWGCQIYSTPVQKAYRAPLWVIEESHRSHQAYQWAPWLVCLSQHKLPVRVVVGLKGRNMHAPMHPMEERQDSNVRKWTASPSVVTQAQLADSAATLSLGSCHVLLFAACTIGPHVPARYEHEQPLGPACCFFWKASLNEGVL